MWLVSVADVKALSIYADYKCSNPFNLKSVAAMQQRVISWIRANPADFLQLAWNRCQSP